MRFSHVDYALALLSLLASLSCFLLLIRNGRIRRWTFLGLLCLDNALIIAVLMYPRLPYHLYFWIFFVNQPLLNLCRVGIGWDVLRSLPANEFIPDRLKRTLFVASIAVAVVSIGIVAPSQLSGPLGIGLAFSRAAVFAWLSVLLVCVIGIASAGFGFTLTGMRIGTGMLIRLASAASYALYLGTNPSYLQRHRWNEGDSVVGVAVFCYWFFSIARERQAEHDLSADLDRLQSPASE